MLIIIAVSCIAYFIHSKAAAPVQKPVAEQSMFEFTGAEGWRKGPTNATSMALFSPTNDDGTSECFTSIEYKTGIIDVPAELEKQQTSVASSGATISPINTQATFIGTNAGQKPYETHYYTIRGGDEQLMGGLGLGYLQFSKGFVEVESHCNTAEQLPSTVPAVQAYSINTTAY